jgi:Predicted solute binding protein
MRKINKKALVILTISLLTIFIFVPFSSAGSGTQVGGIINADTVWTKSNSPYSLTSPVIVGYGATLKIEAGTVIDLNGYNVQVNGILNARGSSTNNIVFTSSGGGAVVFSGSSTSYSDQTQTGCIIENSQLTGVYVYVSSGAPKISHNTMIAPNVDSVKMAFEIDSAGAPLIFGNTITGSIECLNGAHPTIIGNSIRGGVRSQGFDLSQPVIINNTIVGGAGDAAYATGISAYGNNFYIANNTISGCYTGIGLDEGTNTIEGNLIFNNTNGIMISQDEYAIANIRHNTICNNTQGIGIGYESNVEHVTIIYNNLVGNAGYKLTGANVTYNWWGTTNQTEIGAAVSGAAVYAPFLNAPDATAPAIPDSPIQTVQPTVTPSPTNTPSATTSPSPAPSATTNSVQTVQQTATPTAIPNSATEKPVMTPYQASEAIPEFTIFVALGFIALSVFAATLVYYRRVRAQLKKQPIP